MQLCSGHVLEHEYIESASVYTGAHYPSTLGSRPLAGTQGSATQDPHIAASDSSSDFDVMEGYPMQQHAESSSQDMHYLGQQPGASMYSRLKETLSRATCSEHAINEINEGGGEVDSSFTSQIDLVLSESAHVNTLTTTPIGPLKLTLSKTLLPDGRSLAEVQEVECYILAAREKEIESLRKAEQRKEAYSFLDGYSGYNQITIALEDHAKTTFMIEFGVFAFRVMAFGLTNDPATFQRLINTAFKEYLREFCEGFLDDLYIYSSWEEHLSCIRKVFEKCRLYRISLNPFKCQFWVKHGVILGLIVSKNGISTDEDKIKVILELPPPNNYKGVQRFMGHIGYYRWFILLFAKIARPLYKLLIEFKWTEECDQAYEVLKKALASAPILRAPNWNPVFHVHIDASNFAIGCVLTQSGEHKLNYPISFASRQLNDAEKNYTTTEQKSLANGFLHKELRKDVALGLIK
ncbi:hypothetical protein L7F22_025593 [Adiantum nelumboides]|nr:hypothetical protein [Adiantum nelumboides]